MDLLTKKQRSFNMSHIKNKNTRPEKMVRSLLHRMGYRFRLHSNVLPGKPDIILPKYKTVILVHGCFWHRHESCRYATTPATNTNFWSQKFDKNIKNDRKVYGQLVSMGWTVIVVWECEIKKIDVLQKRLSDILQK